MSKRLEQYYPCPGCPFHNFNQVNQCEPKGGTCRWLLSLYDKAQALDAYINCSGNCEQAWHDCGCGKLDAFRVLLIQNGGVSE